MKKEIPLYGIPSDEIYRQLDELKQHDVNFADGRAWCLVYPLSEEQTTFVKEVYSRYMSENALNPMAFKSLQRMEHETVQMTAKLLNADSNVVGTLSSGGTESILLAVKTYRDKARSSGFKINVFKKNDADMPEMIIPESAHIAFIKAAKYFDVKPVIAPLRADKTVDLLEVQKLINKNTILLVGSAPNYPYGTIDPIHELGQLAIKNKIGLHVDACVGGFILPFIRKAGYSIPDFDFSVPGVTSISADLHKYAYAAKGASVILYKDMSYLKHQFFVYANWVGGAFISPALLGTRSGGAIAAAWATLKHIGVEGYTNIAREVYGITQQLIKGVSSISEFEILGNPTSVLFSFSSKSDKVNIFAVGDYMTKKGWHFDRQQNPDSLHLSVMPIHAKSYAQFLSDLADAVAYVKDNENAAMEGTAPMYGMMSKMPLRGLVENELLKLLEQLYGPEGMIPDMDADKKDLKTIIAGQLIKGKETLDKLKNKLKK